MAAPSYSAADFARAFRALLPRGRVWSREDDTVQAQVAAGLAGTVARNHARANQLLVDAFPASTDELLPEWEATLGLPDECAGLDPTLQQRRAQVLARLLNGGGQSLAYFTWFAQNLGFTITVTQYAPARAGFARAGDPCRGDAWAHAWTVNAPLNTVVHARAGLTAAGEPIAAWGNAVLECEIRPKAPAHTTLIFAYS